MNLNPITPFQIIENLKKENQLLKEENEKLREELLNNDLMDGPANGPITE